MAKIKLEINVSENTIKYFLLAIIVVSMASLIWGLCNGLDTSPLN